MLIEKAIAHAGEICLDSYRLDPVVFEWYELPKRILRKTSANGKDLGLRLNDSSDSWQDGDVLLCTDDEALVIVVSPCPCLAITWHNELELAKICYQVGNRHAPLFISADNQHLLMPYDEPLRVMLVKMGIVCHLLDDKLINPLGNTCESNHHH